MTNCSTEEAKQADGARDVLAWVAGLTPFWSKTAFDAVRFYGRASQAAGGNRGLLISGPSRNGNHLVHSLLDGHSRLPRIPGEDSTLNILFDRLAEDFVATDAALRAPGLAAFLRGLSGKGLEDKWALVARSSGGDGASETASNVLWSGMYFGKGQRNFVHDYQDTEVAIDYQAYVEHLDAALSGEAAAGCLHDLFAAYMRALARLDPGFAARAGALDTYDGIAFGSGSRLSLHWMLAHGDYLVCVVPIRPFESYYRSFAKGFYDTTEVRADILKEAWEHWFHKVTDYLIIKRDFPDRLCLVNFVELVTETEATMRRVCEFLGVPFEEICLTPTVLGQPTKGNSSYPKQEAHRGRVYDAPLQESLPKDLWPENYPDYWRAVEALAV